MKVCPQCQYPNPDNRNACFKCNTSLTRIEIPAVITNVRISAPSSVEVNRNVVTVDLNRLHPLESFLWEIQSTKLTEAQVMALIKQKEIDVEKHPAFWQVWEASNRDHLIVCGHSNHTTQEKKDVCLRNQAAKLAIRTIRHYLGLLERHQNWLQQDRVHGATSYVMWSCTERADHRACSVCRTREGKIEPVGATSIDIPHPNCHCTLAFLMPGAVGDKVIMRTYQYLQTVDPTRAAQFENNVNQSGWQFASNKSKSAAKGCSTIPIILVLLTAILLALR